jgi:hypothetical protein
MIIVIQCANRKVANAPTLTLNGNAVHFVVKPRDEQKDKRPWDQIPGSDKTWIDCVKAYNETGGAIPGEYIKLNIGTEDGRQLMQCGNLYKHPVYSELMAACGLRNVYILSAGWGLVRADKYIPNYNITFNPSGDHSVRIGVKDRLQYPFMSDEIPDNGEINLFISRAYVLYWSHLYLGIVQRTVLHWRLGQELPDGQYRTVIKHDCGNQRTNWHYTAARQFIAGLGLTPKSP